MVVKFTQNISSVYSKEGKIIFNTSNKICNDCKLKNISNNNIKVPKIISNNDMAIDSKYAYQITSMMEGVIKEEQQKNLMILMFRLLVKLVQLMKIKMLGL